MIRSQGLLALASTPLLLGGYGIERSAIEFTVEMYRYSKLSERKRRRSLQLISRRLAHILWARW